MSPFEVFVQIVEVTVIQFVSPISVLVH
jgi:hypothetical protein